MIEKTLNLFFFGKKKKKTFENNIIFFNDVNNILEKKLSKIFYFSIEYTLFSFQS